jgi:hypothetical protein
MSRWNNWLWQAAPPWHFWRPGSGAIGGMIMGAIVSILLGAALINLTSP